MATTCYFEETIIDQGGKQDLRVELGRSSAYAYHRAARATGP